MTLLLSIGSTQEIYFVNNSYRASEVYVITFYFCSRLIFIVRPLFASYLLIISYIIIKCHTMFLLYFVVVFFKFFDRSIYIYLIPHLSFCRQRIYVGTPSKYYYTYRSFITKVLDTYQIKLTKI